MSGERAVIVETPGLFTTVQDLGRPGMARFGVTPGGALDRRALVLGNRLLGNAPDAAALECTLAGPTLRFTAETCFTITGADLGAHLDNLPIARWQPIRAFPDMVLAFSPSTNPGARAYVCIAGGIDVPVVLGSRATDATGGFGGLEGRALLTGDRLPIGEPALATNELLRRRLAIPEPYYGHNVIIRVVLGPQQHRFTEQGLATFLSESYRVSSKADRTGIRLEGAKIEHTGDADLISEGIAHGAIQIPGDGQPIVLMAARGTVGGYTKIATVIGADLDALGQVRPGDTVRFTAVSVDEARTATSAYLAQLGPDAITETDDPEGASDMSEIWNPDGVIRILAEAERTGATYLRLEVASAGLTLEVSRGGSGPLTPPAPRASEPLAPASDEIEIVAPVLGTFYRRRTPEEPPMVEVGDTVEAGALLGLIEVMKTYHEVTAPQAGTITSVFAEDGHYVEYGQPLVRLSPAD